MAYSNKMKVNTFSHFGFFEALMLCIGLMACIFYAFTRLDTDLFFIISNGRYILETGDFFPLYLFNTMHEGFETVIQQPLWDVLLYHVFAYFGISAIPFFISIFIFISLLCLLYLFRGVGSVFIRMCLVSLVFLFTYFGFSGRPSTASITDILVSLVILEGISDGTLKEKSGLFLLPLSLFELLCHAAFYPILLFVWGTYLVSFKIIDRIFKYRYMLISLLSSLILSICTPYGIKLPLYSFISYGTASFGELIVELQKPKQISIYSLLIILILILVVVQLFKRRHADGVLLTLIGCLVLMMHVRNLYLLGVFMVPMLKDLSCGSSGFIAGRQRVSFKWTSAIPLSLMVASMTFGGIVFKSHWVADSSTTPVMACDYLLRNDIKEPMYNGFNCGAFLEFNGFDAFIDARPELYSKKINKMADIYYEDIELTYLDNFDYGGFIEKYGFKYFLVDTGSRFEFYLKYQRGFKKILDGNGYSLYKIDET